MDWVSVDGIIGAVGGVLVAAGTVFLAPYRWLQNRMKELEDDSRSADQELHERVTRMAKETLSKKDFSEFETRLRDEMRSTSESQRNQTNLLMVAVMNRNVTSAGQALKEHDHEVAQAEAAENDDGA